MRRDGNRGTTDGDRRLRVSCVEESHPGEFALWEGNCRRSLQGRRGQKAIQALKNALLAMPVKELHMDIFVEPSGETCAIGARMIQKKVDRGMSRELAVRECAKVDPCEIQQTGVKLGMPPLVAWSVSVENDQDPNLSPRDRYQHVLNWVKRQLNERPRHTAATTR